MTQSTTQTQTETQRDEYPEHYQAVLDAFADAHNDDEAREKLTMRDIVDATDLYMDQVKNAITAFQRDGLVGQRRMLGDARRSIYWLTDRGREVLDS